MKKVKVIASVFPESIRNECWLELYNSTQCFYYFDNDNSYNVGSNRERISVCIRESDYIKSTLGNTKCSGMKFFIDEIEYV